MKSGDVLDRPCSSRPTAVNLAEAADRMAAIAAAAAGAGAGPDAVLEAYLNAADTLLAEVCLNNIQLTC